MKHTSALIVGAGSGLSASLARLMLKDGMQVALAARSPQKLKEFADATGARTFECDAAQSYDVAKLFDDLDAARLTPDVVVYNPGYRVRGRLSISIRSKSRRRWPSPPSAAFSSRNRP